MATHADLAVKTIGLCRRFKGRLAVDHLDLSLPRGCVCGFLGPNGAGKTTTLRMLMGLIPSTSGQVQVLGLDPIRQGYQLRSRVGFVPDVSHLYKWMTISESLQFTAGLFKTWDHDLCKSLCCELGLPRARLVKQLSRGELAKLNLILAISHRPELLILDEPTTGLDPLVRGQFLKCVALMASQQNMTVLFSTHILSDIDQIADRLLVLLEGKLVVHDSIEQLRRSYLKVSILFDQPPPAATEIPQALRVSKGLREWVAVFHAGCGVSTEHLKTTLGALSAAEHTMSSEDLFQQLIPLQTPIDIGGV